MDNHPMGWPLLYETPPGMFCLYGKVMDSASHHIENYSDCSVHQNSKCSLAERGEAGERVVGGGRDTGAEQKGIHPGGFVIQK